MPISEIIELLRPHTTRAYIVGGCVRDTLLNKPVTDYDIEVYDISPTKFHSLMQSIGAKDLGRSFFVYRYKNFDLSLPRTEFKNSLGGHAGFSVSYVNDELPASIRRDFTINSIMQNIFTGEILDFHGGVNDLKHLRLKVLNERCFADDSLRIFRAVQFVSRFNLNVESNSLNIMQNIDIGDLSRERITAELNKFFSSNFQSKGVNLMRSLNLDKKLFGVVFGRDFGSRLEQHFAINGDSRTFLYDLIHHYKADLSKLSLSKFQRQALTQPFFHSPSDEDLLTVALDIPLRLWLGLNSKDLLLKAKSLGIYSQKFTPNIDKKAITQGINPKEIPSKIKAAQSWAIKNFLKNQKYKQI